MKNDGSTISRRICRLYLSLGRDLIPLCRDEERGHELPVKQAGKKPLHKNWTNRDYSESELLEYVSAGHNLGFRLGARDLVVDVDPRNGGDKSFEKMRVELGLPDFEKIAPTIRTGGGGTHYYFRIPDGFAGRLHKRIDRFEGIDFCRVGGFVVIPGSYHYGTGETYQFEYFSPYDQTGPEIPAALLSALTIGDYHERPAPADHGADPEFSPEDLAAILDQIPVIDYRSNDKWFELLLAAHYATAGEGIDEFVEWSISDPRYSGDEDQIRIRWQSVKNDGPRLITSGTLLYHLHLYDGTAPGGRDSAVSDFAEYLIASRPDEPADDTVPAAETTTTRSPLDKAIGRLSVASSAREINSVLRLIVPLSTIATDLALRDIVARTRTSKRTLAASLAELRKNAIEQKKTAGTDDPDEALLNADLADLAQKVTATVLREKYDGGRRLIYCDDSNYWIYDGKLWKPYFRGLVERDIYDAVLSLRVEIPDADFAAAQIMPSVERVLRAKVATERRIYSRDDGAPAVINTDDCELWISPDGTIRKRIHKPESYLTTGIAVSFDAEAECPTFDRVLREIFAAESPSDRDQIIRHLWEIIGYLIQPVKNIASWFMFLGSGANGKSVVLSVVSALLGGQAVLEQAITDFGPSGSRYARAALPGKLVLIDDDVSARTTLPDEFLKKISENKWIAAEVKYGGTIRFRSTASVLLAANSPPSIRDLSYGMIRRVMTIPFRRTFKREERDYSLADNIINTELPGILVSALRGLKRLRNRGDFAVPKVCSDLRDKWRDQSNPLYGFLSDCTSRSADSESVDALALWNIYENWILENAIDRKFRLNRRSFWNQIETLGFKKYRGNRGGFRFRGITISEGGDLL